jgi:uncharacterized protein (TIGR03089 family)
METIDLAQLTAVVRDAAPRSSPWRDLAGYIADRVAQDPAKPFVTWYDDTTGERVELSYATFANWVWKTANYVRDGLEVERGAHVVAMLPTHWQTLAVWFGVWSAGAVLVPVDPGSVERYDAHPAVASFVQEDRLALAAASPELLGEVVGLALRPMAARLATVPPGASDYAVEVPSYGDQLGSGPRAMLDDPALPGRSGAQLLAGAEAAAGRLGLRTADRLLCVLPVTDPDVFVATVLAAFHAGAGIVLTRGTDPARLWQRAAEERVTIVVVDDRTQTDAGDAAAAPGVRLLVSLALGHHGEPHLQTGH